jgi:hypothetical protein
MNAKSVALVAQLLAIIFAVGIPESFSQSNPPTYHQLGPAKATLYKPDTGPPPHIGVVVMHRTANFLAHSPCTELSARGFMLLCMNPRFDNNETQIRWEDIALDVGAGVNFLKSQPGITKVVLFGHSGGGPTMSFYQAVAENGPPYCQGPNKLVECGNNLMGLPPADGIVFADAHPGNPVVGVLRGNNPAVVNERRPDRLNPRLDPFDPKNGFNPAGSSTYSEEFKEKYFKGQAERMNRLIDEALEKLRRIEEGKYIYPDNDVVVIPRAGGTFAGGGGSANLQQLDVSVHHNTVNPHKLLKNDGTISTQIVESVRVGNPDLAEQNASLDQGTKILTIKSFLSANAIRATHSLDEIDWCSSNNSVPCAVQAISVPVVFTAMGGFYFIRDNEIHYDLSASADKDFITIAGATHGFTPCVPCESFPGQYSNTLKNFFDYVAAWINARF